MKLQNISIKTLILLQLFFLLFSFTSYSQSSQKDLKSDSGKIQVEQNKVQPTSNIPVQLRYWYFRDRLKYFVVPGTSRGESQISGIRNRWDNDQDKTKLDYGQHSVYLGYYMGVLATEYRLLMNCNRVSEAVKVQQEVDHALYQFIDYLDMCEDRWYTPPSVYDGFFVRWDVPDYNYPDNFWTDEHENILNQGTREADWNNDHFGDFRPGHPGYAFTEKNKLRPEEMSQDEAIGLLLGLALVYKCMGGTDQSSISASIAYMIIKRVSNHYLWIIVNPNGDEVPAGANATTYAYGFAKAGEYFGYDVCDFINCAGFIQVPWCFFPGVQYISPEVYSTMILWDQGIQVIVWGPGDTQNSSMECTLGAIGDSWKDWPFRCYNTTYGVIKNKSHVNNWEPFYLLLYKVLHPEVPLEIDYFNDAYTFLNIEDLCEGPYFYCIDNHAAGGWATSYRWHKNISEQNNGYWVEQTNPAFMGNYNALDYLLLYNLREIVNEENYGSPPSSEYHGYNDISLGGNWPAPNGFASTDKPAHLVATNTITSNAEIMNRYNPSNNSGKDGYIKFLAGSEIQLVPGFLAEKSATFFATIKNPIVCDDFYQNTEGFGNNITNTYPNLKHVTGSSINLSKQPPYGNDSTHYKNTLNKNVGVIIYPNPTHDIIKISLNGIPVSQIINIFVMSINNEIKLSIKPLDNELEINLSGLPSGMYLLKIVSKESCINKKIIKII